MTRRISILALLSLLAGVGAAPGQSDDQIVQPLQRLSLPTKELPPDPSMITNRPFWKTSVTLGFSMTRGNSDTLLAMAKLQTRHRSAANEWLLGANGAYGESDSEKNRETLHGYGQLNHFFTPRFYDFARMDALHDGIKDIRYRFTASAGLGYFLVQQTNFSYALEGGPSLVTERQGVEDQTYAAARFASRLEWKIAPGARVWHNAEFIPQLNQANNYIVNAEIGIETAILRDLSLQVFLQDNYVNLPAPDYKHNDIRLISGLSYNF